MSLFIVIFLCYFGFLFATSGDVCLFFSVFFFLCSVELHKQLNLVAAAVQADPTALSAATIPPTSSTTAAFFTPPPILAQIATPTLAAAAAPTKQSPVSPQQPATVQAPQAFQPILLPPGMTPAIFDATAALATQQQQNLTTKIKTGHSYQTQQQHHHHQQQQAHDHQLAAVSHLLKRDHKFAPY